MKVNKDACSKVLDYMNALTDSWLFNNSSVETAPVNSPAARYSFMRFMSEYNLLKNNIKYRINDVVIECPFHDDDSPSFSFNDKKHVYQCFSCGSHGNIINFLAEYDQKIKGYSISYYQKLNELVINDGILRAELKIDSIYSSETVTLEEGIKRFKFINPQKSFRPTSYLELSSYMKKHNCSMKQIKMFILLMQSGTSPLDIYREIYRVQDDSIEELEELDLVKIMSDS